VACTAIATKETHFWEGSLQFGIADFARTVSVMLEVVRFERDRYGRFLRYQTHIRGTIPKIARDVKDIWNLRAPPCPSKCALRL
jgi:hypothetical protein